MLGVLQGASSYIHRANNRDERDEGKGFIEEIMYAQLECLSGSRALLSLGKKPLPHACSEYCM